MKRSWRRLPVWSLAAVALWACEPGVEVPPGVLDSPAARERGRSVYLENCALCHGESADGRGPRRSALSGPAADFTDPNWRRGTSPGEVHQVIRKGLRGTSMPAWPTLDEDRVWDLVAYLWSVSEARSAGS